MVRIHLITLAPVLAAGIKAVLPEFPLVDRPQDADVVLFDFSLESSLAAVVGLEREVHPVPLAVLVDHISPELAFQMMTAGIRGVIRKSMSIAAHRDALRSLAQGGTVFDQNLVAKFFSQQRRVLTRREQQLIAELARGSKNKEIAYNLGISEGTVKVYLSRLCAKVGAKDRLELALYGIRNLGLDRPGSQRSSETPLRNMLLPPAA